MPGSPLCVDCDKDVEDMMLVVAQGGLYWHCNCCEEEGTIEASEYTQAIRMAAGVPAPEPFGVLYATCAQHDETAQTLH